MKTLKELLDRNVSWASSLKERDPEFFLKLSKQQSPQYLWIGCSDSRVPANQIVGVLPGEIFVHRNVGNVVNHTDFNCLSVIQYAVDVLKVEHIIVCGHYGCGGVQAALGDTGLGLIDNWLRHIRDVFTKHEDGLLAISDGTLRLNRLCELNVIEQVINVCRTTIIDQAWSSGRELAIHGWIYGIENGLLKDLGLCITNRDELNHHYRKAVKGGVL